MIPRTLRCALAALLLAASGAAGAQPAANAPEPGPRAIEIPAWFKLSFLDLRDDVRDAARHGRRVMLYFGQDGCPYCKRLMEGYFGQRDIAHYARRHLDAIALNIWGDRDTVWLDGKTRSEKQLAAFLKVQFTPTLLFLDERGRVVVRLNGLYPAHEFRAVLEYVAQRQEGSVRLADWVARSAGPPDAGVLHGLPRAMPWPLDLDRSRRAATRPLAVFFEQRDCRECDALHAGALRDPQTLALLRRFDVAQIDARGSRRLVEPDGGSVTEAAWARALGIAYAPSVVFFDGGGREVFRVEAYLKTFHFQSALEYVASGSYRTQPSFQRFVQARAEALRARGVQVDLWK
ncbi:MAG TPA: thioredoxin fold domain-containing protein [Burkholderiales bacterium]|nr:thioredoxin fold domain-containing protein [Burkholderiales bacterium]